MENRHISEAGQPAEPSDTPYPWRRHHLASPLALALGLTHEMRIPLPTYHRYQKTSFDCGPYCLSIVANALLGEERFDPDVVAEEMNLPSVSSGPFPRPVIRRIPNWATFPWGITDYLRQHGFRANWRIRGSMDRLLSNLREQVATMVMIGEPFKFDAGKYIGWAHVKALYGCEPGVGLAFVDPGSPKNPDDPWESEGIFWQDEESFLREWKNLFRIMIEVRL